MSKESDTIFARIARRYDLLNRILSLGRDQAWRRSAARLLPRGRVLDLGSGTGAAEPVLAGRTIVALDPVAPMLTLSPMELRVVGIGEQLPFRDGSLDGVFSAYVFRNLTSVAATLAEVHRVLRPGGTAAIVDLSRPVRSWARALHRLGTAIVLPLAGLLIGAPAEYWYLHRSLDKLPPPEVLLGSGPLRLESTWRMGPLGFVYGAILAKDDLGQTTKK
ncbi:MAG TPA: class I SAM-dependent methyltransferase [Acidimicrobiia bacterium]|nr:class I SAM-dependent methyltransferase [Acidimicrobiia bacterium]